MLPETQKLTFPAPRRCSIPLENGKYCTKAYTIRDVAMTIDAGGWFQQASHDFADNDARELALSYYNR